MWRRIALPAALALAAIGLLIPVHLRARAHYLQKDEDVWYAWLEGKRLLEGVNPYARVLEGDGRVNNKYATYFPLFYCLSAATQAMGLRQWPQWIALWAIVFDLCILAVAALIYREMLPRAGPGAAVFAVFLWLFNRWTLYVVWVAHCDPPPILLTFLAVIVVRRRPLAACLLFGFGLALKQIGIFLLPLFLLWAWQTGPRRTAARRAVLGAVCALGPAALMSAPFLVWNARGYLRSIFFSVTRTEYGSLFGTSLDILYRVEGLPAKLPMLLMMGAVWWGAATRRVGRYSAAFLTMLLFTFFNTALFHQYMAWFIPFLPLALAERRAGALGEDGHE